MRGVVKTLITELAVFEFRRDTGMTLTEIAEGSSLDEVREKTEAKFYIASDMREMSVSA